MIFFFIISFLILCQPPKKFKLKQINSEMKNMIIKEDV